MVAGINRTPVDAVMFAFLLALIAVGDTTGEPLLFKVLKASGIVGKLSVKIVACVPQVLRDCLSAIHGKTSMPFLLRDVKG
jgi:Mg2+/citrate symporter